MGDPRRNFSHKATHLKLSTFPTVEIPTRNQRVSTQLCEVTLVSKVRVCREALPSHPCSRLLLIGVHQLEQIPEAPGGLVKAKISLPPYTILTRLDKV